MKKRKNIIFPKLIFIIDNGNKFLEENWIRFLFSEIDEKDIFFLTPVCLKDFLVKLNKLDFPIFIFSENSKLSKEKIYLLKKFNFKYGLIHLSDEWFVANYAKLYNGASFVLRNYLNKSLLNIPYIFHIPIGYKIRNLQKEFKSINKKQDKIFFKGAMKGERIKMLNEFKNNGLKVTSGSNERLNYSEYLLQLKNYKYGLSPYGNTTPDTLRIYEYLENGVLPILGSRQSFDYFILLFEEIPPFLYGKSWKQVSRKFTLEKYITKQNSNLKIKKWWERKKEIYKRKCNLLISIDVYKLNNRIKIKKDYLIRVMSFIWLVKLQRPSMLFSRLRNIFFKNNFQRLLHRIF